MKTIKKFTFLVFLSALGIVLTNSTTVSEDLLSDLKQREQAEVAYEAEMKRQRIANVIVKITAADFARRKATKESFGIDFYGHEAFLARLGNFESSNDYTRVNSYGYMGKYQFGRATLRAINLDVPKKVFLHSPELQEEAMRRLLKANAHTLRHYIKRYEGKIFRGVRVTKSGVLAAAHLGGAGNVIKWFRYGTPFEDAYGTSIQTYMIIFRGYNLEI